MQQPNPIAKLIIVPDWISAALKSKQMPDRGCLDLVALTSILSLRDVSFYLRLTSSLFDKMPTSLRETFENPNVLYNATKYVMNNSAGFRPSPEEVKDVVSSVEGAVYGWSISTPEPTAKNFLNLLPYMRETDEVSDDVNVETAFLFEVYHLVDDVFGVRFYTPVANIPFVEQLTGCVDRTIETLLTFYPFEVVANTRLFKEFADLSRHHHKPV